MPTDQTKTAKDHKNPSYDSNEDGVVEASQLPAVTGLDQGSMSSGDVLKFDGSGLVGGVVETQTPDGISITKNADGELQVETPSDRILGDFENQSFGSWTRSSDSDVTITDFTNAFPLEGYEADGEFYDFSYGVSIFAASYSTNTLDRTIDLTDVSQISFWVQPEDNYPKEFRVDGNTEKDLSSLAKSEWHYVAIDLSGYSGDSTLTFWVDGDDDNCEMIIENIRISKNNTTLDGAGN